MRLMFIDDEMNVLFSEIIRYDKEILVKEGRDITTLQTTFIFMLEEENDLGYIKDFISGTEIHVRLEFDAGGVFHLYEPEIIIGEELKIKTLI